MTQRDTPNLGFVGLGAMGGPMARRLARLGYRVWVHDLDPTAVERVVAAGGVSAPLRELAAQAEVVMTCLPSIEALEAVLVGAGGISSGGAVRTVVDFSTTGVAFARSVAQSLGARGIDYLDAPITGNVVKAGDGTLGIMCSGPQAAFDRIQALLHDLAATIVLYLGEQSGQAQKLKLLNNLLSATGMAVSCEAFILGAKWGLDPDIMLGVINAGDASSSATRNKFPRSVLPRSFDFGARMAITAKDIALNVSEGEAAGVPMWIGTAVREVWHYAVGQGGAEQDGSSLITFLEPWSRVTVRGTGVARLPVPAADDHPIASGDRPHCRDDAIEFIVICGGRADASLMDGLVRECPGFRCRFIVVEPGAGAEGIMAILQANDREAAHDCTVVLNLSLTSAGASQAVHDGLLAEGIAYLDGAWSTAAGPGIPPSGHETVGQDRPPLRGGTEPEDPESRFFESRRVAAERSEASGGLALLLVSGSADTVGRALPVLEKLSSRVVHVSERPGGAHLMRQIEGCVADTLLAVTCEAYAIGAAAGLMPETLHKIMSIETGRNAASERIVPRQVATRAFSCGRRVRDACLGFALLGQEAARLGVSCWILEKAGLLYRLAARLGSPDDDISRLATHYEAWARVEIRNV
jgi:3-hydroxyisobutyrate dehydrogenase-like beta-hydroxyacid dehydrogenase